METPALGCLHPDYAGYFNSPAEYMAWCAGAGIVNCGLRRVVFGGTRIWCGSRSIWAPSHTHNGLSNMMQPLWIGSQPTACQSSLMSVMCAAKHRLQHTVMQFLITPW